MATTTPATTRAPRNDLRRRFLRAAPSAFATLLGAWAALCAAVALVRPLRAITRPALEFLSDHVILALPNLSYATFLGILAAALSTRKRAGWWVLVLVAVINVADAAGELALRPRSNVALALAVVLLVAAVAARPGFTTRVRESSLFKAGAVVVLLMLAGAGIGYALIQLFPGSLAGDQQWLWSLNRVTGGVVANRAFDGRPAEPVDDLLGLMGAVALLSGFATLFQSQALDPRLHDTDEDAVRALLDEYGHTDSLGYFATRRDKAAVFSDDGRAAVLFRVEVGVCLASGDPIGDPDAWHGAITRWQEFADAHGWSHAVMGASEAGAHAYEAAGLTALELGDEAIIETAVLNRRRARLPQVRRAVRRLERLGVTTRIRRHRHVPAADLAVVGELAERWRGDEPERGFSMALGRLGDPADGDCLLVEAIGADGEILAVLSFVPWGRAGVSLDLMRRNPEAPNGVIEYLVSTLAARSGEHRITRISLNFAVLRSSFEEGERIGAGPVLRLWRRFLLLVSRRWQLESLYRSNAKFEPTWVPRFLCFDDTRMLVRIGVACGIAEGFLDVPKWLQARRRMASPTLEPERAAAIVDAVRERRERRARGRRRPEQVQVRLARREALAAAGVDPYPRAARRPQAVAEVLGAAAPGAPVTVAGRLVAVRDHGGVLFATLRDWTGEVQCLLERDRVGGQALADFGEHCDLGDLVLVEGEVGSSRRGERSVLADTWRMQAKSLHPLPGRGRLSPEQRVRQRHLDLAVNDEARAMLRQRSAVLHAVRETLHARDYLEVETPVLHTVHGGANARPFSTYSNAYDLPLSLRIAPELYLKRLCVGGADRVFELGRVFRNEGADRTHNPEFTALEAYEAYGDYLTMRELCQDLVVRAAAAVHGEPVLVRPGEDGPGERVAIGGPWRTVRVHDAVREALGVDVAVDTPVEEWARLAEKHGVRTEDRTCDEIVLDLYEELVEPNTVEPTFYIDFPTSVCPLTRARDDDPRLAERWDLVVFGMELATAYTELTDPVEQRERLERQSLLAAGGDPEAMVVDEEFLQALELGMAPTGGLGVGIDRLLMLISGGSIRDTLAYPMTRPTERTGGGRR